MADGEVTVANKRKPTPAEKAAKKARQKKYMFGFMNGKHVRVKRSVAIDGLSPDELIRRNTDPVCLHQNEMWEFMPVEESLEASFAGALEPKSPSESDDIEFLG
jgi:hypothetical protein